MTDSPSHLSDSPSPDPMIWVGGLLSLAVGVAIFVMNRQAPSDSPDEPPPIAEVSMEDAPHPLAFPPLPADEDRLARARAEKYGAARRTLDDQPEASEAQKALIELVQQANRRQFDGGEEAGAGDGAALSRRISVAANNVIQSLSYDTFPAAGEPLYTACREGLASLLAAVRRGDVDFERAKQDPPTSEFETYRSNCGNLLGVLAERGLVGESGEWAEPEDKSKVVFSVLQRVRWAHMTHDRRPALLQLTPAERALYLRWRIESPRAFPMAQRQKFLSQLTADKGLLSEYDTQLAWARLEWAAGRSDAAESRLRNALEGADRQASARYRRALEWLASQEAKSSNEDG